MPKFLEDKLKAEYPGDKAAPFKVMNAIGAMRGNKETPKGAAMQQKHDAQKPKKKTHPKPMHERMAAAMSRTKTSTPAPGANYARGY